MTSYAELEDVTKRFGRAVALDRASFTVGAAEVVAVLGPNGAGKTTAISLLVGLRRPDSGTVRLFGSDPRRSAARRELGATPQETAFPLTLRVGEVLELVRAHYERPATVSWLAEQFGLSALLQRQVGGLSGGERRRVSVALAFAGRSRLVVLDEPTAGLDRASRLSVWDAIRAHADAGGSLLLTTHHLEEADALARRIVLIERGRIVADGPVAQVKAAAGTSVVRFRAAPGVEVEGAVRDGEFLRIQTRDGGAEVERLVRAGVALRELVVRPLTLEEALAARNGSHPDGGR